MLPSRAGILESRMYLTLSKPASIYRCGQNVCWRLSRWFSGDVPVPAKLSRHADSDDRRAGSINGHLLRAFAFRLQWRTLTMFAMVLAIGLWSTMPSWWWKKNVERIIGEEGLTPREATRTQIHGTKSGGAGRCIAMVLSAVFVPMCWRYTTGAIYRRFSYYHCLGNGAPNNSRHDHNAGAVCATLLKPLHKASSTGRADFSAGLTVPSIVMPNTL